MKSGVLEGGETIQQLEEKLKEFHAKTKEGQSRGQEAFREEVEALQAQLKDALAQNDALRTKLDEKTA